MLHLAKIFKVRKVVKIPGFILRLVTGKHVFSTLTMNTQVSNELIRKELGWGPNYPSYREGLRSLIE